MHLSCPRSIGSWTTTPPSLTLLLNSGDDDYWRCCNFNDCNPNAFIIVGVFFSLQVAKFHNWRMEDNWKEVLQVGSVSVRRLQMLSDWTMQRRNSMHNCHCTRTMLPFKRPWMLIWKGLTQWKLTWHLQSNGDNKISNVQGHSNLQMEITRIVLHRGFVV